MIGLIDAAFSRSKVVLLMLAFLLAIGSFAYSAIPRESSPEIPIPIVYVSTGLDGISPEDAEDVLVGPMETEFASLTGLTSMTASASEGHASVQLEFEPGFDADNALDKVREAADKAENELPQDARVTVTEINTALFPILTVILSGPVPERTLNALADDLQDGIEAIGGVLEVEVGGKRTELLEVLIDPTVFETYNISFDELIGSITRNNQLIAAGAILVGLAIPGAFLTGVAGLYFMGFTMNIVVLFSLILVVGMLVDGAIVTVELADRLLAEGKRPKVAYAEAAKRMAWPIIASTATTLCVFFPLLFWSDTVGEFMKFLPITVIFTLSASLFMALVFIPVMGGLIGKRQSQSAKGKAQLFAAEKGDPRNMTGLMGRYIRVLQWSLLRPWITLSFAIIGLVGSFVAYGSLGNGLTFFPDVEPDYAQVEVRAKDNFSVYEQDGLVRQVENKLIDYSEIASIYARSGSSAQGGDVIGSLQLELAEWDTRRPVALIAEEIRADMAEIPGIDVQVQTSSGGPGGGKPINMEILSRNSADQIVAVSLIEAEMERIGGFIDVVDSRPSPGVEWQISVDRSEAARSGADVALLGQAVQLLTRGITVADYRPDDSDGEVDIVVRFPAVDRTLAELESLRVPTTPKSVTIKFGGEAEEQADSMVFLLGAFASAIGLMFVILLTQFNSFWQAFIVMSAIVFSIAGVLLGLMVTGRPFGVVMGGIGVIALAGIVVNNNIVLIDTYNSLRKKGIPPLEAALRTGAQHPQCSCSVNTAVKEIQLMYQQPRLHLASL